MASRALAAFLALALIAATSACDSPDSLEPTATPTEALAPPVILTPTPLPSPTPEPIFVGEINGVRIDPNDPGLTAFDVCPGTGMSSPPPATFEQVATAPGPLQIDPNRLPPGITSLAPPDVFLCKGAPAQIAWIFTIAAGTPNVNPGGGSLTISRIAAKSRVASSGPASNWQPVSIGQAHGAVLRGSNPASPRFPSCVLALYNPQDNVTTEVFAPTGNSDFCTEIARKLFE